MESPKRLSNSGVYAIWLYLPESIEISIGKLGRFPFEKGVYVYCGSAQRYLTQRIARHAKKEKNLHWHVDYLRFHARYLGEVIFHDQPKSRECWLVRELLGIPGTFFPVPGFGSSDCSCGSHLLYISVASPVKRGI